jgi:hypothetical protein
MAFAPVADEFDQELALVFEVMIEAAAGDRQGIDQGIQVQPRLPALHQLFKRDVEELVPADVLSCLFIVNHCENTFRMA